MESERLTAGYGGRSSRILLAEHRGENLGEVHGKFGAWHNFVESRGSGFGGEVGLNMGEKANHANSGLCSAKALNRVKGRRLGVEVEDDQGGSRIEELQQGIGVGCNFHFETEMLGGFRKLHLKEKIIHVGYDAVHWLESPKRRIK